MQFNQLNFLQLTLLGSLLPVISGAELKSNPSKCVDAFDDKMDYFPIKTSVDTANLFKVQYKNYYKIVENLSTNETVVLYQCGTKEPKVDKVTKYIPIPLTKVLVHDTTTLAFLEALGVQDTIKVVDTASSITSPCYQKAIEDKSIETLSTTNKTLASEQLEANQVNFHSFGDPKINETKRIVASVVSDPGLLERAEWLEYYALFYNLEGKAQELTAEINNNYNCLKAKAKEFGEKEKLKAAWVAYVEFEKQVYYTLSNAPFKKKLLEDAGAELIVAKNETINNVKELLDLIKEADVIIDESFKVKTMEDFYTSFKLDKDSSIKAIKNQKVLRLDGIANENDGFDWFENAVVMGDAVLQDLIRALYSPKNKLDGVKDDHLWFRNIAKDEEITILTSKDCKKDQEWKDLASKCGGSDKDKKGGKSGSKTLTVGYFGLVFASLFSVLN